MLHVNAAGTSRQAVILAAIVSLHAGLLCVVINAKPPGPPPAKRESGPVWVKTPPPLTPVAPKPLDPMKLGPDVVSEPYFIVPDFDRTNADKSDALKHETGSGPEAGAPPDVMTRATIALDPRRISALIDRCYPSASRRMGEEGTALVRVLIGAGGQVTAWRVLQGSGFPRLDAAVPCVLGRLPFAAATRNGMAVQSEVDLPVVFRLN